MRASWPDATVSLCDWTKSPASDGNTAPPCIPLRAPRAIRADAELAGTAQTVEMTQFLPEAAACPGTNRLISPADLPGRRPRPLMKKPRLILTADDFGLWPEINDAVVAGYESGVISSASLRVSATGSHSAAVAARIRPG